MSKHPKKLSPNICHSDLAAGMDYLHGDVEGNEFEAACSYEYARESLVLRYVAKLTKKHPRRFDQNCIDVTRKFKCDAWFIGYPWALFWSCRSFPQKQWNQLNHRERSLIARLGFPLPIGQFAPLRMNEVWLLDAMGVFDELKTMAAAAVQKQREETRPGNRKRSSRRPQLSPVYPPIIEGWPAQQEVNSPWIHALFTIDFRKAPDQLIQEFKAWLELSANRKRRASRWHSQVGKTGSPKDRLKDLAAMRLYDGHDRNCDKANEFANQHRKTFRQNETVRKVKYNSGDCRPFHNAGKEQKKQVPLNEAALHSEQSGFIKAGLRVAAYLAKLMPAEFAHRAVGNFEKRYRRALAKQKKISKR